MENLNDYLSIIASLLAFYVIVLLFLKYMYKQTFTPVESGIPDVAHLPELIPLTAEPNVYETEDTRMQYPLLPPVSPMVRDRVIRKDIPANSDLYSSQTYTTKDYVLDTPPTPNTNELVYSGGDTQMISIPLQYNYPFNEQLRSNNILITPYNKIKYGTC